jgi:hypothetical protein
MSNVRPRHLLTFKVEGRAVPWKVGMRRKDKRLRQWQSLVRDTASVAWGVGRLPHVGPVALSMWFYVPSSGRSRDTDCRCHEFREGFRGFHQGNHIR